MLTILLSAFIVVSVSLLIRAVYRGPQTLVYILKPLSSLLVICVALSATAPPVPAYRNAIILGLVFSLLGDVLLVLPSDRFVEGLAAFLIAHICYIVAFTSVSGWMAAPVVLVGAAVVSGSILARLWRHLGSLRVAVTAYVLVISTMVWQGIGLAQAEPGPFTYAGAGAVLFVLSDAVLAINRFARPFAAAEGIVLSTYYAGQWLIAISLAA